MLRRFSCRGRFVLRLSRNVLVLVFLMILWSKVGQITTHKETIKHVEKEPEVCFSYPMSNVSNIIKDINILGHARVQPINNVVSDYEVLLDPSTFFCSSYHCPNIEMIFIVKSYILNFNQRNAIRQTWGSHRKIKLKTIFVIGILENMEERIQEEFQRYNDILLFNLEDIYENLVYKTIFASLWLSKLQPKIRYIHFLDDDRIVNTLNVYYTAIRHISLTDEKMIGYKLLNSVPRREVDSRHYVSKFDYPPSYFPPYLIGGTILTNLRVVNLIAQAVSYVKIMKIEDAYIGIVANLMQIEIHHHSGFLAYYEPAYVLTTKLSIPGYETDYALFNGWELLSKSKTHIRSDNSRK